MPEDIPSPTAKEAEILCIVRTILKEGKDCELRQTLDGEIKVFAVKKHYIATM